MCPKVNLAYSHGPSDVDTSDNTPVGSAFPTAFSSIPLSCMRTQSDHSASRLIYMCHLDEGEDIFCDSSNVYIEDDFLLPLSSSPPENSSSPYSVTIFSDEEGSVISSSPLKILTGLGSSARNSDEFSQSATCSELILLENRVVKSSCTQWSSPSSSASSAAHDLQALNPSYSCPCITGQIDADSNPSASDGKKTSAKTSIVHPHDTPSPGNNVEISPITFSQNSEIQNAPLYRLIKRARSYNKSDREEPLPKKMKIKYGSISDYSRRVYAPRTASLRKAESLTTTSDLQSSSPLFGNLDVGPVTPKPARPLRQRRAREKILPHPVPIIAPPEDHVAGLPVSAETLSVRRLKKFLERELDQRAVEGLSAEFFYGGRNALSFDADSTRKTNIHSFWEGALGIGRERRLRAIEWLLNVKPVISEPSVPAESPRSAASPTVSLGSSSASSDGDSAEGVCNLLDQLQTSHETRFHACWMFLRYFYLVMSPEPQRVSSWTDSLNSDYPTGLENRGRELVILDISVACLSLSVKFHRDFLDPLSPVYAHEYLALSPHRMSYDDLEMAHRDILSAFRYRLGVSPQSLMDELWSALPLLRELLYFERGWSHAMEHAWTVLFRAVCEADVQMFSVSLLTTVAIMDGVIQSLEHRYFYKSTTDPLCQRSGTLGPIPRSPGVSKEQASKNAEDVLREMQALVGASDMQVRICRFWMGQFEEI